ncbi:inositol monophosphatase family protein [Aquabacter spiritensis]|uniref:Myo-inositol-1(Or 4)-monophosphatase n=1 Tax=Aquabacter spiritensis TaxID=933073 RepID=A0A4R3LYC7_9HYPH|nr:inositol monophosphatase [Aquabacter spiritensis]TCT05704.1 myo-inositol-1(or 4)-monophosphatase [Aquabacter spiritensis]
MSMKSSQLSDETLKAIEALAVDLARLAGSEITAALGGSLAVRYKPGAEDALSLRDPVSEVDTRVEEIIRLRLADSFPDHEILGEEFDDARIYGSGFIWAVDPIDGTTNFVNGFPLFAGSIGVLYEGRPVAGALWVSTSHALRPGIYHARKSGPLMFETDVITPSANAAVRRRLVGQPGLVEQRGIIAEPRKTGSAAVECAFVAAGLMQAAWFAAPNVWDVAGGLALVEAAGGAVQTRGPEGWAPFSAFAGPTGEDEIPDLRAWRQPIAIGEATMVEDLCAALA